MNWDQIKGQWTELRGALKVKWGRLTDSDLMVIQGKRDQLVGKLREVYGLAKAEAERQVSEFGRTVGKAAGKSSGKAKASGANAVGAVKTAGRAALAATLDAAEAGLDKVRGLIAPRSARRSTALRTPERQNRPRTAKSPMPKPRKTR